MKEVYIIVLLKKENDLYRVNSYCPISLLNTDISLLAKGLTNCGDTFYYIFESKTMF